MYGSPNRNRATELDIRPVEIDSSATDYEFESLLRTIKAREQHKPWNVPTLAATADGPQAERCYRTSTKPLGKHCSNNRRGFLTRIISSLTNGTDREQSRQRTEPSR